MMRMVSVVFTFLLALGVRAIPWGHECPPLHRGTFNLDQYQLYPENADWDEAACVVYFG